MPGRNRFVLTWPNLRSNSETKSSCPLYVQIRCTSCTAEILAVTNRVRPLHSIKIDAIRRLGELIIADHGPLIATKVAITGRMNSSLTSASP